MFSSMFDHIKNHKLGYSISAVLVLVAISTLAYYRGPVYDAASGLTGNVGRGLVKQEFFTKKPKLPTTSVPPKSEEMVKSTQTIGVATIDEADKIGKIAPSEDVVITDNLNTGKLIDVVGGKDGDTATVIAENSDEDVITDVVNENFEEELTDVVAQPAVAPELYITAVSGVDSSILTAGSTSNLVAKYRFQAKHEDWNIKKLTVLNDSAGVFETPVATAAVSQVSIKYPNSNGEMKSKIASLTNGQAKFAGLDFYVPANGQASLEIHANINTIAAIGESLSGQMFRLGVKDMFNDFTTFEAVSQASTVAIYNPTILDAFSVEKFIVRKTAPTISKLSASPMLSNGERALYSFSVTADNAGSLSLARLVFEIEKFDRNGDNQLQLSEFKLYRGSNLVSSVGIHDIEQKELSEPVFMKGTDVIVAFYDEESVSAGSTQTYTLRAAVSGVEADDKIRTRLKWGDDLSPVTNKSANTTWNTARIFSTDSADGLFQHYVLGFVVGFFPDRNFIWSDRSASPHTYGSPVSGSSSYDWTNGYLLDMYSIPYHELNN